MRSAFSLFVALSLCSEVVAAQDFNLSGYQEEDGAITNSYKGTIVEPYFATKALLILLDADPRIKRQALLWVSWALEMQQSNGLFERYIKENDSDWRGYSRADADDSMCALWLELLYRLSPDKGLPAAWKESADMAEKQLDSLYDPVRGIYEISSEIRVGLLMDNSEIYAAFRRIAREQKRLGNKVQSKAYYAKAENLRINILKIFRPDISGEFLVSTQAKNGSKFYPDKTAQIFPVFYAISKSQGFYRTWVANNGKEWLAQGKEDYPWGFIAIVALREGDMYTAKCWKNHAEPMRYSKHWNVIEEVALQYVDRQLTLHPKNKDIACVGGYLS